MPKITTTTKLALALSASLFMSQSAFARSEIFTFATSSIGHSYEGRVLLDGMPPNLPGLSYELVGSLPAGLSFNSTTGIVSGTPTVTGSTNFTVNFYRDGSYLTKGDYQFWVWKKADITASTTSYAKIGDQITLNFTMPFSIPNTITATEGELLPVIFESTNLQTTLDDQCSYHVTYLDCQLVHTVTTADISAGSIEFRSPGKFQVAYGDGQIWSGFTGTGSASVSATYSAPTQTINPMPGQRLVFTQGQNVDTKLTWHPVMAGSGIPHGSFTLAPPQAMLPNNPWTGNLPAGLSLASDGRLTGTLTEAVNEDYIFYVIGDTGRGVEQPLWLLPFVVTINPPAPDTGNGDNGGSNGEKPKFVFRMTSY